MTTERTENDYRLALENYIQSLPSAARDSMKVVVAELKKKGSEFKVLVEVLRIDVDKYLPPKPVINKGPTPEDLIAIKKLSEDVDRAQAEVAKSDQEIQRLTRTIEEAETALAKARADFKESQTLHATRKVTLQKAVNARDSETKRLKSKWPDFDLPKPTLPPRPTTPQAVIPSQTSSSQAIQAILAQRRNSLPPAGTPSISSQTQKPQVLPNALPNTEPISAPKPSIQPANGTFHVQGDNTNYVSKPSDGTTTVTVAIPAPATTAAVATPSQSVSYGTAGPGVAQRALKNLTSSSTSPSTQPSPENAPAKTSAPSTASSHQAKSGMQPKPVAAPANDSTKVTARSTAASQQQSKLDVQPKSAAAPAKPTEPQSSPSPLVAMATSSKPIESASPPKPIVQTQEMEIDHSTFIQIPSNANNTPVKLPDAMKKEILSAKPIQETKDEPRTFSSGPITISFRPTITPKKPQGGSTTTITPNSNQLKGKEPEQVKRASTPTASTNLPASKAALQPHPKPSTANLPQAALPPVAATQTPTKNIHPLDSEVEPPSAKKIKIEAPPQLTASLPSVSNPGGSVNILPKMPSSDPKEAKVAPKQSESFDDLLKEVKLEVQAIDLHEATPTAQPLTESATNNNNNQDTPSQPTNNKPAAEPAKTEKSSGSSPTVAELRAKLLSLKNQARPTAASSPTTPQQTQSPSINPAITAKQTSNTSPVAVPSSQSLPPKVTPPPLSAKNTAPPRQKPSQPGPAPAKPTPQTVATKNQKGKQGKAGKQQKWPSPMNAGKGAQPQAKSAPGNTAPAIARQSPSIPASGTAFNLSKPSIIQQISRAHTPSPTPIQPPPQPTLQPTSQWSAPVASKAPAQNTLAPKTTAMPVTSAQTQQRSQTPTPTAQLQQSPSRAGANASATNLGKHPSTSESDRQRQLMKELQQKGDAEERNRERINELKEALRNKRAKTDSQSSLNGGGGGGGGGGDGGATKGDEGKGGGELVLFGGNREGSRDERQTQSAGEPTAERLRAVAQTMGFSVSAEIVEKARLLAAASKAQTAIPSQQQQQQFVQPQPNPASAAPSMVPTFMPRPGTGNTPAATALSNMLPQQMVQQQPVFPPQQPPMYPFPPQYYNHPGVPPIPAPNPYPPFPMNSNYGVTVSPQQMATTNPPLASVASSSVGNQELLAALTSLSARGAQLDMPTLTALQSLISGNQGGAGGAGVNGANMVSSGEASGVSANPQHQTGVMPSMHGYPVPTSAPARQMGNGFPNPSLPQQVPVQLLSQLAPGWPMAMQPQQTAPQDMHMYPRWG